MTSIRQQNHGNRRSRPQEEGRCEKTAISFLLDNGKDAAEKEDWHVARSYFLQAVDRLKEVRTDKSIDGYPIASVLSDLGFCCSRLGLLLEASTYWHESLKLKRDYYNFEATVAGKTEQRNPNLDLAHALEDAGSALVALKDYDNAKVHYHEALDMKRLVYGKMEHLSVQQKAELKAQAPETNDYPQGHLGIRQQLYGYDRAQNTSVASTLSKLGEISHLQGCYHKASKMYSEALHMYRAEHTEKKMSPAKAAEPQHVDIACLLAKLGHIHADMSKRRHAIAFFDQAIAMMENLVQESNGSIHRSSLDMIKDKKFFCLGSRVTAGT